MDEEEFARRLTAALVGRRCGIVAECRLVDADATDAPLHHAGARIAHPHPHWGDTAGLAVGGSGATPARATISALCEAVERFCGSHHRPLDDAQPTHAASPREEKFLGNFSGTARDLNAFLPFDYPPVAPPGHPVGQALPVDRVRWVATTGFDGQPGKAPAFAVYLMYEPACDEPWMAPSFSTGLACGPSLAAAQAAGLCELIERDAMALHFVLGLSPPRVPAATVAAMAGDLLPPGDDVRVYDLTSDLGVPVMLAVLRGRCPVGPLVAVGAACRLDPVAALRKACMEASQTRVHLRLEVCRSPYFEPAPDFANVTDFTLHARAYCGRPKLAELALAFLDQGEGLSRRCEANASTEPRPSGSGGPQVAGAAIASIAADTQAETELATLTGVLRDHGHPAAWVDLTQPWCEPLGLRVVRCLAPTLAPLHGDHRWPALRHPRMAVWATALPYARRRHRLPRWPYPHPCP